MSKRPTFHDTRPVLPGWAIGDRVVYAQALGGDGRLYPGEVVNVTHKRIVVALDADPLKPRCCKPGSLKKVTDGIVHGASPGIRPTV